LIIISVRADYVDATERRLAGRFVGDVQFQLTDTGAGFDGLRLSGLLESGRGEKEIVTLRVRIDGELSEKGTGQCEKQENGESHGVAHVVEAERGFCVDDAGNRRMKTGGSVFTRNLTGIGSVCNFWQDALPPKFFDERVQQQFMVVVDAGAGDRIHML